MKAVLVLLALLLAMTSVLAIDPPPPNGHETPAAETHPVAMAVGPELAREGATVFADPLTATSIVTRLAKLRPDEPLALRGAREVRIYATFARAVVLLFTEKGFGSGSVIGADGSILTNWHVVAGRSEVGVIFKPVVDGGKVTKADVRRARVVHVDEVADLALLQVESLPPGVKPIPLGELAGVQVGADVHAIGHPTGESWTYTKGIVSQIRRAYEWSTDAGTSHRADVIQTQTPINPGNSGGPLISDNGELVGVNSFKAEGEALNFAIAVSEVRRFLSEGRSRYLAPQAKTRECEGKILKRDRTRRNDGDMVLFDLDCDGKADGLLTIPDDSIQSISFGMDTNHDGKTDVTILDRDRDGRWDVSYYDIDYDGKSDVIGYHPDGKLTASRYEPLLAAR